MKTHWFVPLIRPAIKPLFLGGVRGPGGGWLNSHEKMPKCPTRLFQRFLFPVGLRDHMIQTWPRSTPRPVDGRVLVGGLNQR